MSETIINKVAESGLITIDLESFYPRQEWVLFDLKDYLFMGLILKEKDFREALKKEDWEKFRNKHVAITCSAEAIIPVWAYMLVTSYLQPIASNVIQGDEKDLHRYLFLKNLATLNVNIYMDKKVVVKGCGDVPIAEFAYIEITRLLRPVARSVMYGEPCSTVPIFKKATTQKEI